MRRAFSYARFSTAGQLDGRSLKRQEEAAKAYADRHGLVLDDRTFMDLGVSGYHGANATVGELGVFLDMVREGRIPKGSVLIVENIDRLSRLPPHEANNIIMALVKAGVEVVTTSPEQVYNAKNIHQVGTWIPLQVAQALASEESRKKGERCSDAYAAKRAALPQGHKMTKKGPAWLQLSPDRKGWIVIEEKAALVRKMFQLAIEGYGVPRIAGLLDQEYPEGLTGKGWQPGYICRLLRSRSVVGEYLPHVGTAAKKGRKATRKPAGDPIKGYFPAIVTEADFYRVQAAVDGRRSGGGRATGTPNLFNGLLYDAADGKRMICNATHGRKVLVSSGAIRKQAGSAFRSIYYGVFERAILSRLRELTPADVMSKPGAAADREAAVTGRLVVVNRKRQEIKARADQEDDVTDFLDLLASLDRQRKALIKELEQIQAEKTAQGGDNVGELTSLIGLLDEAAPEDKPALRTRIKAGLRRVVNSIWVWVVRRNKIKVIRTCVFFNRAADGKFRFRNYLIVIRAGTNGRPGGWAVEDWSESGTATEVVEEQAEYLSLTEQLYGSGGFVDQIRAKFRRPDWNDMPINPLPTT
jgi:DNA invertase Pin-like site-specific DNA recombinase